MLGAEGRVLSAYAPRLVFNAATSLKAVGKNVNDVSEAGFSESTQANDSLSMVFATDPVEAKEEAVALRLN